MPAPSARARSTNGPGNGRTAQENRAYAQAASLSRTRQQKLAAAAVGRQGRRDAARKRITERDGPLPEDEMERAVDAEIRRQMAVARAKAATARRQVREATQRAAAADAELIELAAGQESE